MNTLRDIKQYLKILKTETIVSARGNKYEVATISRSLWKKIIRFKSLSIVYTEVGRRIIWSIVWYEGKKRIEILVKVGE